jgi:hypothetical protein
MLVSTTAGMVGYRGKVPGMGSWCPGPAAGPSRPHRVGGLSALLTWSSYGGQERYRSFGVRPVQTIPFRCNSPNVKVSSV